jgi:hypothetical protein
VACAHAIVAECARLCTADRLPVVVSIGVARGVVVTTVLPSTPSPSPSSLTESAAARAERLHILNEPLSPMSLSTATMHAVSSATAPSCVYVFLRYCHNRMLI